MTKTLTPSEAAHYLPESFLVQVAYGLEIPADIAARYGIDASTLNLLESERWYQDAIERKRQELLTKGDDLLTGKFRMMAEDAGTEVFKDVVNSTDPEFKLKAFQTFAKLGGLEPKTNSAQVGPTGPQFSISINIPTVSVKHEHPDTLKDVTPKPVIEITMKGESSDLDAIPEVKRSEGFRLPDFDTSDLVSPNVTPRVPNR